MSVNGSRLDSTSNVRGPETSFPYAQLATTALNSTTNALYIYHHINASTFAQEMYDKGERVGLRLILVHGSNNGVTTELVLESLEE